MNARSAGMVVVVLGALAGLAVAHDDDPKSWDARTPMYRGAGWSSAADPAGEQLPVDFPAWNVELLSWKTLSDFPGGNTAGNDSWGYVSETGREYAIIGLSKGTGFVEVTNPRAPVIIGFIPGPTSTWRDIKVYRQYAYAVSEGGQGIQVIDLRQVDHGQVTLIRTVTTGGTAATHNVALNEASGFLYRCGGGSSGLRIYDLADPENPNYVGAWSTKYVHDCQAVTYTEGPYQGREIVFAFTGYNGGWDQTGVDILDVTNKQAIRVLKTVFWPQAGYSHQGWLSPDRRYLYVGDELDEREYNKNTTTPIIDVGDLDNATLVGSFQNGSKASNHNMYSRGKYLFQANYTSGLRVLDISNPTVPVEVAYFDTVPTVDSSNFNGLWSNYPYLPSGIILGSDMQSGLFVWKLTLGTPGDLNCDGAVNFGDINPFVLALGNPEEYARQFPDCDINNADVNEDGQINFADINPFVELLGN